MNNSNFQQLLQDQKLTQQKGEYAMSISGNWRLILLQTPNNKISITITDIVDYH